jgi:hypothetical protein
MLALIGKPGPTCTSQRDHPRLHMLYNIGARASETSAFAWPKSSLTVQPACTCAARGASSARDVAVAIDDQGSAGLATTEPWVGANVGAAVSASTLT